MQPFDGNNSVSYGNGGLDIFFNYFNSFWPWLLGVAAGIGVLWGVVGGFMVMMSGGSSDLYTRGKERITWALIGLSMLALAGFILKVLNPNAFV